MSNDWLTMLQDENRYLYHYTKADTLLNILRTGNFRFSSISDFNDPREYLDWSFQYFYTDPTPYDQDGFTQLDQDLSRSFRDRWKIGCFVVDVEEAVQISDKKSRQGTLDPLKAGFERGHSRPTMWAPYGGNSSGACLVFDKAELLSLIESNEHCKTLYRGKVHYSEHIELFKGDRKSALRIDLDRLKQLGIDSYVNDHMERYRQNLFFAKSSDWSAEREFRVLIDFQGKGSCDIPIKNSLVGIILGSNFAVGLFPEIGEYSEKLDIPIATIVLGEWVSTTFATAG